MGFIKHALIGIVVYETVKYLNKRDELSRTKLRELQEKAPVWLEKAKAVKQDIQEGNLPQGL